MLSFLIIVVVVVVVFLLLFFFGGGGGILRFYLKIKLLKNYSVCERKL